MKQIEQITQGLWDLQDCSYRDFQAKLIPTLDKEKIIGVRTPALRKYAKEVMHHPQVKAFLLRLPHTYYEENNLHGELLCLMYKKDLEGFLAQLEKYLPYIDNWATCDMLAPKVFCQDLSLVYQKIQTWLASEQEYTVRFGIVSLMRFYLDEAAIGMVNQKTTAVRVIPVVGKGVGETVEFGGLLGYAPIMPVNQFDCSAFVNRKGRIPAPIHSFKN